MIWNLIEFAPKDQDILVLCENGYITIANWQEYLPEGFYWAEARCADGLHVCEKVTHWMELPKP